VIAEQISVDRLVLTRSSMLEVPRFIQCEMAGKTIRAIQVESIRGALYSASRGDAKFVTPRAAMQSDGGGFRCA